MKILDEGHKYLLDQLGTEEKHVLKFLKRSGKIIEHEDEHPGLQTQEVLRVLIDRTEYLNSLIPCAESQDAAYHLRMALYMYEVRAYRRKMENVNRQDGLHEDQAIPNAYRDAELDIPFSWADIEELDIGEDGHVVLSCSSCANET